eukprot:CAMPEP_0117672840 /NCGR_PEP_ID=MMETSP0804-20121206/14132_1 /TAXON_ID=1074897 /ORGANISM="Tetraselmis astigmatica, Strain CCMP880" /LENGTH=326 /DNA_ID=CAMNT_0005481495 /DNA_START=117 /DNA_END=1097 /DNA_ORIENTATION=+
MQDVINFSLQANRYLNDLQTERTLSTCHTSTAGDEFRELLDTARKSTDKSLDDLKKETLYEKAGLQFNRQQALMTFRLEVDMQKSTAFQVLTGYNMLIESLVDALTEVANQLHCVKDKSGVGMGCYSSFLCLQNVVSQQCAIVTGTVADKHSNGKLFPMGHLSLVTNLGAQKAYMNTFLRSGIPDDIKAAFIVACHDGPNEVLDLERAMVVSLQETAAVLSCTSAHRWLCRFAERLDKLSQVNILLLDHVGKLAEDLSTDVQARNTPATGKRKAGSSPEVLSDTVKRTVKGAKTATEAADYDALNASDSDCGTGKSDTSTANPFRT